MSMTIYTYLCITCIPHPNRKKRRGRPKGGSSRTTTWRQRSQAATALMGNTYDNVVDECTATQEDAGLSGNTNAQPQTVSVVKKVPLDVGIADLALTHGWSHSSIRDLLDLLSKNNVQHLPKDPRTVMKTPRHVQVRFLCGDSHQQYFHFGLQAGLEYLFKCWPQNVKPGSVLQLQLNIDGTPVCKSTSMSLWPILGLLRSDGYQSVVFCIGVYYGRHPKQESLTDYLQEFVDEYQAHESSGYLVHGKTLYLKLSSIICDAPAMAFVKVTKNHNAYGGCPKCEVFGESLGCMTFPDWEARRRTDQTFINRSHRVHHAGHTRSPFEQLGIGMITQIPLDAMHLAFLGVMKRVLRVVLKRLPKHLKMSPTNKKLVSAAMLVCARFCPSEFQRRPRELADLAHFKATEFRAFLCYLGPVLLRRRLAKTEQYEHFLLFSCAMRILLSSDLCRRPELVDSAENMLLNFCKQFGYHYDMHEVVYNVHCLSHLAQEAR